MTMFRNLFSRFSIPKEPDEGELDEFKAAKIGWTIPKGWKLKLKKNPAGKIDNSLIAPDKTEFTDLTPDDMGNIFDFKVRSPRGITYSKADIAVSDRTTTADVDNLIKTVFPKYEPKVVKDWQREKPDEFLRTVQKQGRNETTERLIKGIYPDATDQDLEDLFPEPQIEMPTSPLQAFGAFGKASERAGAVLSKQAQELPISKVLAPETPIEWLPPKPNGEPMTVGDVMEALEVMPMTGMVTPGSAKAMGKLVGGIPGQGKKVLPEGVLKAAREGKPIPPEVLKEFPELALAQRDTYLRERALSRNKTLIDEEIKKVGNREVGMKVAADRLERQVDPRTGVINPENIKDAQLIRQLAKEIPKATPGMPEAEAGARTQDILTQRQLQAEMTKELGQQPSVSAAAQKKILEGKAAKALPQTLESLQATIKYFKDQEAKWADTAFAMAQEGRDDSLALTRAKEFGNKARDLESIKKPIGEVTAGIPPEKPPRPVATGAIPPEQPKPLKGTKVAVKEPETFAGNIRLSKYPEDVQEVIKQWATDNPEVIQTARRGKRPDAVVLEDARRLVEENGGDFARVQKRWKPGEAWNAEEVTAIRGALRSKSQEVLDLAAVAKEDNSAANHMKLLLAMEEQSRLQEIVTGITAEAGRSLRAFRQEAFDAIAAKDVQKIEKLLKLVGGDRSKLDEVADALSKLDLNDPVAVNNFIRSVSKPKAWDYVTELWYNSILSGPKTHIINALSNTITTLSAAPERAISAFTEKGLSILQGRQAARFFSEVPADAFGALEGLPEGLQGFFKTLKTGLSPQQATKWEFRPHAFKGVLGRTINTPSTLLEASDVLNRAINYRAAFNALVVRAAKAEGKTGTRLLERIAELKANPTTNIMQNANKVAEYRLFRQEAGGFTSTLMSLRDKFPPLRFVIPFLRTPVNLLKFGLERSPLGIFNPKLWRNLASKSPEASDQLARVFIGSSVAATFAYYFSNGRITGAAPTNATERDKFYREGKLPYAVKIGNTWIQYQRLEPLNQVLSQVAAVVDAVKSDDKTIDQKVGQAIFTISKNLVSQTYMSSISDLIDMISDPERYGTKFAQRQAAGLITPFSSLTRTVAQGMDPTIRTPETFIDLLKSNLPILSQQVPAKLTVFGEESKRQTPVISPISIATEEQSKVDKELERIGASVGFVGSTISGRKLTPEEQQDYQERAGKLTYQQLSQLINSTQYLSASDPDKVDMVESMVSHSREAIRKNLPESLYNDYFAYYAIWFGDEKTDSSDALAFRKSHPEFEKWGEANLGWKPLSGGTNSRSTTTGSSSLRSVLK